MKSFLTYASLIALASAIPCHTPKSTVTLRLISSLSNHYSNQQQTPTTPRGNHLNVIVGQTLSLDHAPMRLQAIEIASISEGADLSSPARHVVKDDSRVVCKAMTGYGCKGMIFGVQDSVVDFMQGEMVDVTGLECWLE